MSENGKIKLLVIPSDKHGVGKFRSVSPHVFIQERYKNEFDVDIKYADELPLDRLTDFFKQYDLIHIHKKLDNDCKMIDLINFLGIPVIIDVDDYFYLGDYHPMSYSAKRERWQDPIIAHLKKATYVSTTTEIYAKELRKYNKNVLIFPNAIGDEETQYTTKKTPNDGRLRVGLICGSSHEHDINILNGVCRQVPLDKVQFVLCGFDVNGTRTIYLPDGKTQRRPIEPSESVWNTYEKVLTDNYKIISPEHKQWLLEYHKNTDDPFIHEPYRRMWTRDITKYGTHYENVDVLMAPLKECPFNMYKSELKEVECGFTNTAFMGQNFGAYTINLVNMIEKGGKVNPDGTALLVDTSKNHKQWGKYITKLANDREMVKNLQENLSKFVRKNYSNAVVQKHRAEEYKRIVDEAKTRTLV